MQHTRCSRAVNRRLAPAVCRRKWGFVLRPYSLGALPPLGHRYQPMANLAHFRTAHHDPEHALHLTVATVLLRRDMMKIITVRCTTVVHPQRDGTKTIQRQLDQATEELARLHGEHRHDRAQRSPVSRQCARIWDDQSASSAA